MLKQDCSHEGQFEGAKYVINSTLLHWLKCCTPFCSSLKIIFVKFLVDIEINSMALIAKHLLSYFENSDSDGIIDALSLTSKYLFCGYRFLLEPHILGLAT